MTSRDDMVIRPSLEGESRGGVTPTPGIRRSRRAAKEQRSLVRRIVQAQAARRATMALQARRFGNKVATALRLGKVPAALAVGIALLGAARIMTGRSVGNLSANLSRLAFGDAPAQARATELAKQELLSDPLASRIAGRFGSRALSRTHEDILRDHMIEQRGIQRFRTDKTFQTQSMMDAILNVSGVGKSVLLHDNTPAQAPKKSFR